METTEQTCTAFQGMRKIAGGTRVEVALALKRVSDTGEAILVFDDATGKQVEFDLRGSDAEIAARLDTSEPRKPGRPKLGVTAREVTLLPRQWDVRVVHEMVHYLQAVARGDASLAGGAAFNVVPSCRQFVHWEFEAYAVQREYILRYGTVLPVGGAMRDAHCEDDDAAAAPPG